MKKIYIIVSIFVVILAAFLIVSSLTSNNISKDAGLDSTQDSSGNMEDYSTDDNTIDLSQQDDDITLTFDSGCQQSSDFYVDRDEYPGTSLKVAMLNMQERKCFAQPINGNVYAIPVDYIAINGTSISDTTPVYAYVYVYGEGLDYKKDIYVEKKDGTKIYPNDDSVINEKEGYLFFEVEAMKDIKDIRIGGDLDYSLLDIEAEESCVGDKCAP